MIIPLFYLIIINCNLQYSVTAQSSFTPFPSTSSVNSFGNIPCKPEIYRKSNDPWVVYLLVENKDNTTTQCSGAILTFNTVLTSATCLENAKPNNWSIYGHLTDRQKNYTSHHVRTFFFHPLYFNNSACDLVVVGIKEEIIGNNEDMYFAGGDESFGIPNEVDIFPLQQWHNCHITGVKKVKNITTDFAQKNITLQTIFGYLMNSSECNSRSQSKAYELGNACFSNTIALDEFQGAGLVCHSSTWKNENGVLVGIVRKNRNHLSSSDALEIVLLTKAILEWIFMQMSTNFVAGRFSEEEVIFNSSLYTRNKEIVDGNFDYYS